MAWATRPRHTSMYTLSVTDGSAEYYPGALLTLRLTTNRLDMKWIGLLLHAVDASNTTVGGFEQMDADYLHEPPTCPGTVMHSGATEKPYTITIFYRVPVDLTRDITFR